ncbi:MAG TPA: ABC transporter substrate-binding protein [Candidatus Dormibacteraeota bacterium]
MFSQTFREKIAVAFFASALTAGVILGFATARSFATGNQVAYVGGGGGGASGATGAASTGGGGGSTAGSGGNSQTGGGSSAGSAAAAAAQTSNSQAASGVSGSTILVGGIFDMTGPVDASVERDAVRAYFAKVNAQGGINGRKIVMVYCDSQYDPTQTHSCALQMAQQHVLALVGSTYPKAEDNEVNFIAKPESQGGAGIPVIGGLGTPNEFKYPISFPTGPNFIDVGLTEADRECQFAAQGKFKHPAVVTLSDIAWVQQVVKVANARALQECGLQHTDEEDVSATQPDYDGTVFNLEHNGCNAGQTHGQGGACPDGLVVGVDPGSIKRLFDAMKRANWFPPVFGFGLDKGDLTAAPNDSNNFQYQYGYGLGSGPQSGGQDSGGAESLAAYISPYDNRSNATVSDYLNTIKAFYPSQVPNLDVYCQNAWDAAAVFVQAAKNAGANLTRASLVQALDSLSNFQTGWTQPISYTSLDSKGGHEPTRCFHWLHHDDMPEAKGGTWHTDSTPVYCQTYNIDY